MLLLQQTSADIFLFEKCNAFMSISFRTFTETVISDRVPLGLRKTLKSQRTKHIQYTWLIYYEKKELHFTLERFQSVSFILIFQVILSLC